MPRDPPGLPGGAGAEWVALLAPVNPLSPRGAGAEWGVALLLAPTGDGGGEEADGEGAGEFSAGYWDTTTAVRTVKIMV